MSRKDGAFVKINRLGEIQKSMVKGIEKGIDLEKLIDEIEYAIGLSRATAIRYVDVIISRQGWIVNSGKVVNKLEKS